MSPTPTGGKLKGVMVNAGKFVGLTAEWGSYHLIASMCSVTLPGDH